GGGRDGDAAARIGARLQRRGALPPERLDDRDRRLPQRRQAWLAGERCLDRGRQLAALPLAVDLLALGEFRHDLRGKGFDRLADVLVAGSTRPPPREEPPPACPPLTAPP